jgi:hypothetical protein
MTKRKFWTHILDFQAEGDFDDVLPLTSKASLLQLRQGNVNRLLCPVSHV